MPDLALQHIALLEQLSYLGVFIAVVLAGHFVPVPEDISLVAAGYIVAMGYADLLPMLLVGIVAPILADSLLFFLARAGSRFAPNPERYANSKIFGFGQRNMRQRTYRTVFLMRFVTGFRFMSPVMAAYLKLPVKKYMMANAFSALFFGPFFIILGYTFSEEINTVIKTISSIEHTVLIVLGLIVLVGIGIYLRKMYNDRNATK